MIQLILDQKVGFNMQDLIIIGTGKTSEIIYEYLKDEYNIIAFAETNPEKDYWNNTFIPIYSIDLINNSINKTKVKLFIAIAFNKLNTIRKNLYFELLDAGWDFISYVHPRATVMKNVAIGKNCFIMEENVIQDFVSIGDNNIFWSGNHIGHHSNIGSHNFISSHVVICGNCQIGDNNFFGVNSCVGDGISIGNYNWFSPMTSTVKSLQDENLLVMPKTEISPLSTKKVFKVS